MSVEAPVAPAPTQSGSAFPSSSGEINAATMMRSSSTAPVAPATKLAQAVRPPAVGEPPVARISDDGKKPSDKLFENLRGLANKDPNEPKAAKKPVEAIPVGDDVEGEVDELVETTKPGEAKATDPKATTPGEKKKVNPWKVIEEHKTARAKLEAEIAELKKSTTDFASLKAEKERLAAIENRNKELEEKIKFVDYKESAEFKEKYQKPYEAAWTRAMSELNELTITDPDTGSERPLEPSDLLSLVNMPLKDALETAEELYGSASGTVMAYRKEIKALYQQQAQAIEAAKKNGVESSQKQTAEQQEAFKKVQEVVSKQWEDINKSIIENETTGVYFRPVEGDEQINSRLEKGYKFVDETMAVNPLDPKLTPEQRADAVKRHASLRHRAAAFGRMRMELEAVRKSEAEYKAKLEQYEKSTPSFGGDSRETGTTTANGSKMPGLMQRLASRAK